MRITSNTTGSRTYCARRTIEDTLTAVSQTIRKLRKSFKKLWIKFQIRQMQSVLQELNDEQLDRMSIKRDGIKEHAKHLITYEYDGL
ncbi:MAG: hypothetical protein ACI9RO_000666 [Alteromonas macleodii]|jgi:predicted phage tail protein